MKNIRPQISLLTPPPCARRPPAPKVVVAGVLTRRSANLRRIALLFATLISISTLHAGTTFTVQDSGDGAADANRCPGSTCRLRDALAKAAASGDTINFSVTGAITLNSGQLLVDKSVTITGPGAASLAVDGNAASRVFLTDLGKTVSISGLTIRNGLDPGATGLGGGIYNWATLTLTDCVVTLNHATIGAGIYNNHGTLTITNSTLSGNSTGNVAGGSNLGGGIYNDGAGSLSATVTITNSTLSGNHADVAGAAIFNDGHQSGSAPLTITNCTLSNNSGPSGGIHNFGDSGNAATAPVKLGNTILNGAAGEANIDNDGGTVTSKGYNLDSDGSSGFTNGTNGDIVGSAGSPIDAKLGPLEDNGGPTFTHELLVGSPAIDKGKDLSLTGKDQRGRTRPIDGDPSVPNASGGDGSDIGAFELVTHKVTNTNNSAANSLRQALLDSLDGDAIYFDPSLNGQAITLTSGELLVDKSVTITGPGAASLAVDGNAASRVFHISAGKTATISGLTIRNGLVGGGFGGGIYNDHATLTLADNVITLNKAPTGGGIANDGLGGSTSLTITNSTLSGNSATDALGSGGGIVNFGNAGIATLVISNSTLSVNSAPFGGGIYSSSSSGSASVTISNSTLSGNLAPTRAGGIMNDGSFSGDAVLTLANCTLSGNSSSSGASIANDATSSGIATVKLGNTILQAKALEANITNAAGVVTSNGYNLSSDAAGGNATTGPGGLLNKTGDIRNTDPMLGPLEDNGGPTFTHELLVGSPAIDKGKDLSGTGKDQRGRTRPVDGDPAVPNASGGDGSDIGAFELVTHKVTNTNDSNAGSLRQALADSLDGDGIYFDVALNGQAITLTSGELLVSKSVDISGPGANLLAVDGNANSRVFAIYPGTTATISGLTIRNGNASGAAQGDIGGGIYNSATLTLKDSAVTLNHATLGGGIFEDSNEPGSRILIVSNCTFSGNSADSGGGVYNDGHNNGNASLTITNATLSGNHADTAGADIFNDGRVGNARVTITNSTLSAASGQGGSIHNNGASGSATVTLGNTILNGNAGPTNIVNDSGTVTSSGHNLSSDAGVTNSNGGTGALNATGDQTGTAATPLDPKLGPLQDNGGPTFTRALLPGSPALDAGDNTLALNAGLTTDQRGSGFSRILDAASDADTTQTVDIGAFEADPSIEDITNKSTAEDTPLSFIFKVGDSATGFGSDSITPSSSNTSLVPPNENIAIDFDTVSTRKLTITPAPDQHGTTTITLKVTKTINGSPVSMSDTFVLTVTAVNDAPIANPQSVTTKEDTAKAITLSGSDVDADPLTFSVVTGPAHGTLTGAAPNLTYKPKPNYNGSDSFTFKANDGHATSNTATVSITVGALNDPPTANAQSVTANEDIAKAITLTGSDVDGNTLTFNVVTGPAHGTLTGTAPNLTYKPKPNYNGADSFTFKANDGHADSNVATVSITVSAVNDAPTANAQSVTTNENIPKAITLTGSDTEGSTLTFHIVTGPAHGTLTGTPPNLTYMPAANYHGADSFTFKANDGGANSNPATVSITITGPASHPLNLSTRLNVLTGENVLIGGFYITGSAPKKVIVRAIGPSLNVGGVPINGRLGDTVLELFDQTTHQKVASNNNWKVDDATGGSQEATIVATKVPPPDDLESALVVTLKPGPYSAIVSGKDGSTGIALVEAYDLDTAADSKFANISTRGFVAGGSNVMIGGFILGASQGGSEVLVRAIGPSLTGAGVANALPDPRLEIHSENGAVIATNDNWKTDDKTGQSQEAAITATTIPPTKDAESALLLTLPPGNYTAVLGGNGAATGVALVEIYNLQ
jgi:hypothetical protein